MCRMWVFMVKFGSVNHMVVSSDDRNMTEIMTRKTMLTELDERRYQQDSLSRPKV